MLNYLGVDGTSLRRLLMINSMAQYVREYTETGNPVAFQTNLSEPLTGFTIPFLPVQSGTGDPSPENVRPISGWTGLTAWRTGKNLIKTDKHVITSTIVTIDGESNDDYPTALKAGTYTISFKRVNDATFGVFMKESHDEGTTTILSNSSSATSKTFTIGADGNYRFWIYRSAGVVPGAIDEVQLELGSTASPYAEYTGQSYPVTFPDGQTVYGGTLDAVTGVLTVTHKIVDLSSFDWELRDTGLYRTGVISDMLAVGANTDKINGFAERYPVKAYNELSPLSYGVGVNTQKRIFVGGGNTGSGNFVYPLATPIEITLDPITVQTLLGDNVIWSDTNGENTVKYKKKG